MSDSIIAHLLGARVKGTELGGAAAGEGGVFAGGDAAGGFELDVIAHFGGHLLFQIALTERAVQAGEEAGEFVHGRAGIFLPRMDTEACSFAKASAA